MVAIRTMLESDAESVCRLYNRIEFGVARFGHVHTPDLLLQGIVEGGVVEVLVAVHDDEIVGTAWLMPCVGQRPSGAGAIHVENLAVDPNLRMRRLAGDLLLRSGIECATRGFRRVDLQVAATNRRAIRLYRKAGFKLVSTDACEDGLLLMVNHPGAVGMLIETGLLGEDFAFRYARSPASVFAHDLGSLGDTTTHDLVDREGRRALTYQLRLPAGGSATAVVDADTDEVSGVRSPDVTLEAWPDGPSAVAVRLAARRAPAGVTELSVTVDGQIVERRIVALGEEPRIERVRLRGCDAAAATVTLNRWSDAEAATPLTVTTALTPASGRRSGPATCRLHGDGVDVEVDVATGATAYRLRTGDGPVAVELWPEVGPPFPGGHKSPLRRPVELLHSDKGCLILRSRGNPWLGFGPTWAPSATDGGYETVRTLRADLHGVVRVDTTVRRLGESASPVGLRLRTFGRATLPAPVLAVATVDGAVRHAVEPGGFPFTLGDAEHMPLSGLPTDPEGYVEPRSAFESAGTVVGLMWPGAIEVRFGGVWMPSALYDIPPLAPGEEYALPPYHVVALTGDERDVAAAWRSVSMSDAANAANPAVTSTDATRKPAGNRSGPVAAMPAAPATISLPASRLPDVPGGAAQPTKPSPTTNAPFER